MKTRLRLLPCKYIQQDGDFINDAKELVETAWDWSALRETLTISTVAEMTTPIH